MADLDSDCLAHVQRFCTSLLRNRATKVLSQHSDDGCFLWHPRPSQETYSYPQIMRKQTVEKMILAWYDIRDGLDADHIKENHPWLTDEMRRALQHANFMRPLSLDPLPTGISIWGMVVDAFRPFLDIERVSSTSVNVYRHYDRAIESAVVGWETGMSVPRGLEEVLEHGQNQVAHWRTLSHDWTIFIDSLLEALENNDVITRGGLLVLTFYGVNRAERHSPVRIDQILDKLHHPRVVYLLAMP